MQLLVEGGRWEGGGGVMCEGVQVCWRVCEGVDVLVNTQLEEWKLFAVQVSWLEQAQWERGEGAVKVGRCEGVKGEGVKVQWSKEAVCQPLS